MQLVEATEGINRMSGDRQRQAQALVSTRPRCHRFDPLHGRREHAPARKRVEWGVSVALRL